MGGWVGGWVVGESPMVVELASSCCCCLVEWLWVGALHQPAYASIILHPLTRWPIPFYIHCSPHSHPLRPPGHHDNYLHRFRLSSLFPPPPSFYYSALPRCPNYPPSLLLLLPMSTTAPEKPPRKFPPPCWTQEETLALIDAYRDRWYALRRGYLRTADWDSVAAAVALRCPDASPSKTSAQCRHKMEKLRQRYRAEKQRSLSFPGRFFSSWFFFDNMEFMEIGSSSAVGSNQDAGNLVDPGEGLRIKSAGDRNTVETVFRSKNSKKIDANSSAKLVLDQYGVDPGGGARGKALGDRNSVTLGFVPQNCAKMDVNSTPNFCSRVLNGYPSYLDDGSDEDVADDTDFGTGFPFGAPFDAKLVHPVVRAKKLGKIPGNFGPNFGSSHDDGEGVDVGGFCGKNTIDQVFAPPGFRSKKFGRVDGKLNPNFDDEGGGFCVKMSGDRYPLPIGLRAKNSGKNGGNSCPNIDPKVFNGFSSNVGLGVGKKSGGRGVKRERGPIAEMVSSIKMLGEGFVQMEKMKMEMAREIEKTRMEMEIKRNELILESQRQIVDAFVTVLLENKKKKENPTMLPES